MKRKKSVPWLAGVLLAALLLGIGTIIRQKAGAAEKNPSRGVAQTLYSYRTQYIGDNSRVANISDRLPCPGGMTRRQIALSTARAPYAAEIAYRTADGAQETTDDETRQKIMDRNAVLMFALIQNLNQVDFRLGEEDSGYAVSRTREWANSTMGKDVWASSNTEAGFTALYTEADRRFSENGKAPDQPVKIHGFIAAECTAPLSGKGKALLRLVMTDGQYFSEAYAGAGGGIYSDNYKGSYELQVVGPDGSLLSKTAFVPEEAEKANFPGKFTLLSDDYNGDGNPDFTIGEWGSSTLNLYEIYTLLPNGTVKKISGEAIPHLSRDFSVQFEKDGDSGFRAKTYNNATGETADVPYLWDPQRDVFSMGD